MAPDVPNPAFPRAIPHGMVIIGLLDRVLLFGLFSGCLRVLPWGGSGAPSGHGFGGVSESTFLWALERKLAPEVKLDAARSLIETRARTWIHQTRTRARTSALFQALERKLAPEIKLDL